VLFTDVIRLMKLRRMRQMEYVACTESSELYPEFMSECMKRKGRPRLR